jgi:hypothetical protein
MKLILPNLRIGVLEALPTLSLLYINGVVLMHGTIYLPLYCLHLNTFLKNDDAFYKLFLVYRYSVMGCKFSFNCNGSNTDTFCYPPPLTTLIQ